MASDPKPSGPRASIPREAVVSTSFGLLAAVVVLGLFLVPWYQAQHFWIGDPGPANEYWLDGVERTVSGNTTKIDVSALSAPERDLLRAVSAILIVAGFGSVLSVVLSYLHFRVPGVIIGSAVAVLLVAAGAAFCFGIVDALSLDQFGGMTHYSKSYSALTEPLAGYYMAYGAAILQSVQAILLAYSGPRGK